MVKQISLNENSTQTKRKNGFKKNRMLNYRVLSEFYS
jgi:hypothetical protein